MKILMKNLFFIILILTASAIQSIAAAELYEMSYEIYGSAKGRVLLIFPYRVYYSSAASLTFSTSPVKNGGNLFTLYDVGRTGYMIRTLGFSGRSLGIMTADNDVSRGKNLSAELKKEFSLKAPEYSKFIRKSSWNNFLFNKIQSSIKFLRSSNGINSKMKYRLWLKRSPGEKPLRINFNIYRILGEVIRSFKHSFLPAGKNISDLITAGKMKWTSGKIDFSEMLARSALYSAAIFKKIKRLKQEKPFYADFSSRLSKNGYLKIKGSAEPDVSVWGSFRIKKFIRNVIIRIKDQKLISDNILIEVYNDAGQGGTFRTTLQIREP